MKSERKLNCIYQIIIVVCRLTSLSTSAFMTTPVRPLSCKDESREGSWKTYTVTVSIAKNKHTNDVSNADDSDHVDSDNGDGNNDGDCYDADQYQ